MIIRYFIAMNLLGKSTTVRHKQYINQTYCSRWSLTAGDFTAEHWTPDCYGCSDHCRDSHQQTHHSKLHNTHTCTVSQSTDTSLQTTQHTYMHSITINRHITPNYTTHIHVQYHNQQTHHSKLHNAHMRSITARK